jgi:drug/metabolite transporter (DMT)-like permease
MILTDKFKGYLFAFITTITLSNVYIFSKSALNEINLYQFGFYWFGFAIIWNILYSASTGYFKTVKKPNKFQLWTLFGMGITEVIATSAIFIAIKIIPNPTIPAFIRNLEPVLIVFMAIIFLKERYNKIEIIGVVLTILGTFIISYNTDTSLKSLFIPGVNFILISCFFYAIRTIWSKKVIHHFTALSLNLNKVVFLFLTAAILLILTKSSIYINKVAFWNIFIGSIIGPFITSFFQFISLKYIDASRATLIQSTTGFITLILAWVYFKTLPMPYQIVGGFITIIGLVIITTKRPSFIRKKNN